MGATLPLASTTLAAADTGDAPAVLHVAQQTTCSDSGSGTEDQPYCTISAAAAAAQPGQTVLVEPGSYNEAVTLRNSGTAAAPITFVANNWGTQSVSVGQSGDTSLGSAFVLSGVQDVVLRGFTASGGPRGAAVVVNDSADVTLDHLAVSGAADIHPEIQVTGTTSGLTVSRTSVHVMTAGGDGVQLTNGVHGTVLTGDSFFNTEGYRAGIMIDSSQASGTVVTGNTLVTNCADGIDLSSSPGATVENNIVETAANGWTTPAACTGATYPAHAVVADSQSAAGTTVDDNVVDQVGSGSLYQWAGTGYTDSAAFAAATGQAAADVTANPKLTLSSHNGYWFTPAATSPAIDSADQDALDELTSDALGNPREDDPAVQDGPSGYFDRGSVELIAPSTGGGFKVQPVGSPDPLEVTVTPVPATPGWAADTDSVNPPATYQFNGDTAFPITSAGSFTYTFRQAGVETVTRYLPDGTKSLPVTVVLGADYTPVAPTRLLDTRHAIGVATTTPVPANGTVDLTVPGISGVPAADISALVANVTVTQPTAAGHLTVYPDNGSAVPTASNLNFGKGETVPNLVTVPMGGGRIAFHNAGSGTVHVLMDLQGFYGRSGNGFKPQAPTRVLDTRSGLGAPSAAPIAANGTIVLDLSHRIPADATAVVLNLTVTQPKVGGHITAYPADQPVPNASNVNFSAGETVPNLAVVPVADGKIGLTNSAAGTTHLVADLEGYFGTAASGANQSYVPYGPGRVLDTRNGTGAKAGAVGAYQTLTLFPGTYGGCTPRCPDATDQVLNVTVTQPQKAGVLTVYPQGQAIPTASNLNFSAGETVPNLVSVIDPSYTIAFYNHSAGSVQLVADQEGYYIAPQTWANT